MIVAAAAPAAIVTPAPQGAPWSADGIAALRRDLDALLRNAPALRGAHYGVYAIDAATGEALYAHNASDEFQPALTLKLLVGSAALERLGPDYRFVTTAAPMRSAANGDVEVALLTAGGDPFLAAPALDDAVATLLAAGFHPSLGWAIDDSRYDLARYPNGWTWDDFAQDYAVPLSAMTFEENVLHLTVTPGANVGDPAHVASQPLPAVGTPVEGTCGWFPRAVPVAKTAPAGTESTLDVERSATDCTLVVGSIAQGAAAESLDAAVVSPILYAQSYLNYRLRLTGATIAAPATGAEPPDTFARFKPAGAVVEKPFWTHESGPLQDWLGPRFWIPSDNLVAELLLKELGFVTGGKPGTTGKGIAFERTWLNSLGVDPVTTTLADGSGLSQYDRITPRDLVAILTHDWNGPNRDLVLAALPVGGARGTIEGIAGTPAAGRVFAKTGSMMHVRGLAGYLAPLHHGAVIFAFSVDDWNGDYPSLAALRAAALERIIDG